MTKSTILQEVRAIQAEMRKDWYDDISNLHHKFSSADHNRYAALDNLVSILEAIQVEQMKDLAKLIIQVNAEHSDCRTLSGQEV